MQKLLFPDSNSAFFGPNVKPLNIGDNVHELSDKQLAKMVGLKFKNDPFLLIRQLSKDLASKETELILLRKEKFQREQELVRLCTEYGNLSSLEIDQRLNALKIGEDVHEVLQEMIHKALDEEVTPESPRMMERPDRKNARRERQRARDSSENRNSKPELSKRAPKPEISKKTQSELSKKSPTPGISRAGSESPREFKASSEDQERRPSRWLTWFNSSEDLTERLIDSRKTSKVPVELESMGLTSDGRMSSDPNTDRYGFYNDVGRRPQSTNFRGSPGLPTAEATISSEKVKSVDKLKHLGELHDAKTGVLLKKWDLFMRDVSKGHLQKSDEWGQEFGVREELFGAKALNLKSSTDDEESRHKKLCRLVHESGIPPKYRNRMWFELSGAQNKEVHGEFQRLVDLSASTSDAVVLEHIAQINLDLHRTMPLNCYFNDVANSQPGPHYYSLRNILYAFVVYKPDVGYSQGLNKIVGNLLLGVNEGNYAEKLTDEDVFWIFVCLTEELVPAFGDLAYFHQDALQWIRQDLLVVQDILLPRILPKLHQHLTRNGVEVEVVMLAWWLGLFTESFVLVEFWFKIFDSLLVAECAEVKFVSYSLALFKLFERTLLELDDGDDIYRLMNNLNHNTGKNVRFHELVSVSGEIERQIDRVELEQRRNEAKNLRRQA